MSKENPIQKAYEYVGGGTALANKLGVSPSMVTNWAKNRRPVPIKRCVQIELLTGGAVTRKDLRPDDWHEIWPELENNR